MEESEPIAYGYIDDSNGFQIIETDMPDHLSFAKNIDIEGDGLKDDYYQVQGNTLGDYFDLVTWIHNGPTEFIQQVKTLPGVMSLDIYASILPQNLTLFDLDHDGLMEFYYYDIGEVTMRIEMLESGTWGEPSLFRDQLVQIGNGTQDEVTGEFYAFGYDLVYSDWNNGDWVDSGGVNYFKLNEEGDIVETFLFEFSFGWYYGLFNYNRLDLDADGFKEYLFAGIGIPYVMYYEGTRFLGLSIVNGIAIQKNFDIFFTDSGYSNNCYYFSEIRDVNGDGLEDMVFDCAIDGLAVALNTAGSGCTDPNACNFTEGVEHLESLCCYGTCGCTDDTAINYNEEATCDNGSCQIGVTGRVYHDVIGNGIFDEGDYGLAFQTVTTSDGSTTYITNEEGCFTAVTGDDNVLLTHVSDPNFPYYSTPSYYQTNLSNGLSVDFGLSINEPLPEVEVFIYHDWYTCDDDVSFYVAYRNRGNTILNGQVEFTYDQLITGHTAISPITSLVANTLTFDFENLMPGQMQLSRVSLHTPDFTFMGEIMDFSATVNGYSNDILSAWGTVDLVFEHGCSYDPNDIQATPNGYTDAHYIEDGTAVEYLVRFQNTGNAPALNVRIDNVIDENLDLSSFQLIANSHDVSVAVNNETRELQFFFNEIMLPDSNENEEASHGFLSYRISIDLPLETGTEIHNTASIYFDNNPAVLTNTTLHTIYNCEDFVTELTVDDSEWCAAQTVHIATAAPWADEYVWSVNGEIVSETNELIITEAGEKQITLVVDNPLCGVFEESLILNLNAVPNQSINASATTICEGEAAELEATYAGDVYSWSIDDEVISTDSVIFATTTGTYQLTTTMGECVQTNSIEIVVTSYPQAIITQSMNVLSATLDANWTYQWYFNNEPIPGAISNTYEIASSGLYQVQISNGLCTQSVETNASFISVAKDIQNDVRIYPNPTRGDLVLTNLDPYIGNTLKMYDLTGRVVFSEKVTTTSLKVKTQEWAEGLYRISLGNQTHLQFVKLDD
jgi:uncharacterized repeat protein (TIGR01451 family)